MAKNFVNLSDLTTFKGLYDTQVADAIATASAKSLKTVAISGQTLNFYREEEPVGSATPAYSITLPQADLSGLIPKISGATGSKVAQTKADGTIEEASLAVADIATKTYADNAASTAADGKDAAIQAAQDAADAAQGDVDALETLVGTIPAGATATTVTGYIDEAVDGLENSLAAVAFDGAASNVVYDNSTSGLAATSAQGAIDEVVASLGTAAAADVATTAIVESSTDDSLVSAAQVATFVASEIAGITGAMHFIGVITRQTGETDAEAIARVVPNPEAGDVVVMSDNAKEYIYDGTAWREVGDETEFVKKTTTIAGVDLADNITKTELLTALNVEDGADVNTIESVKVNGSALTPDANKAVNVTVAEGATNGTIAVNGSDVAVHGLGSAAYTASTAYDASGSAAAVLGTSSDTSTDNTVYGAKALANDLYDDISNVGDTAIQALFA